MFGKKQDKTKKDSLYIPPIEEEGSDPYWLIREDPYCSNENRGLASKLIDRVQEAVSQSSTASWYRKNPYCDQCHVHCEPHQHDSPAKNIEF